MKFSLYSLLIALGVSSCSKDDEAGSKTQDATSPAPHALQIGRPQFNKVMIVIYENESDQAALAQPYFGSLRKQGALLTQFYAETHPSQPNYIALISGDLQGVIDDRNHDVNALHLGDLLEAKHKTWKNYAEDLPSKCFTGAASGRYVRKHVPFISFKNVQNNPERCARIVPATQLATDLAQGSLPDFSIYTPNLANDGHDTGIAFADRALRRTFEPLINNPKFMDGMLLIVTFDEDNRLAGNHIYTLLLGDSVMAGSESGDRHNHYSLLRLIEDQFELGTLGKNDATANPVTGIWRM